MNLLKRSILLYGLMRAFYYRYNGYGGKPEPGEPMLDCAVRELHVSSLHLLDTVLF